MLLENETNWSFFSRQLHVHRQNNSSSSPTVKPRGSVMFGNVCLCRNDDIKLKGPASVADHGPSWQGGINRKSWNNLFQRHVFVFFVAWYQLMHLNYSLQSREQAFSTQSSWSLHAAPPSCWFPHRIKCWPVPVCSEIGMWTADTQSRVWHRV